MTRALLLSVKHKYAEAILNGTKTLELRRRFPVLPPGTLLYIYSSGSTRAITGTVTLEGITRTSDTRLTREQLIRLELTKSEAAAYLAGASSASVLHLGSPRSFSVPIALSTMRDRLHLEPVQSYRYVSAELAAAVEGLSA